MKFISFLYDGEEKFGVSDGKFITDLTGKINGCKSLKELIEKREIDNVKKYTQLNKGNISEDKIKFLPVITKPDKIICVGLNYKDHVDEIEIALENNPVIFLRIADSQTAHKENIVIPKVSNKLDYECELAVIIGKYGRYIEKKNALDYITGYSCYNDCTVRDWQQHTSQFTMGKNFEKTGSFGPYMILSDNIQDYRNLSIQTRLNGKVLQKAKLDQLIFDIPTLISYISKAMPLRAGDVIVTGTPGGVGFKRNPPIYMKDGDNVEVEISNIGTLKNVIKNE
tara:strand:- start:5899 stop:6744 length:846 start_codon:yes stop_codon:yes gene_type:complete